MGVWTGMDGVLPVGHAYLLALLTLQLWHACNAQREAWRLGSVEDYALVNQGGCFTLRDVDDRCDALMNGLVEWSGKTVSRLLLFLE